VLKLQRRLGKRLKMAFSILVEDVFKFEILLSRDLLPASENATCFIEGSFRDHCRARILSRAPDFDLAARRESGY